MATIQQIKDSETYKQIIRDSFGGVMYNVANQGKYDTTELLELWNNLDQREKNSVDGIMKGAMHFIEGN